MQRRSRVDGRRPRRPPTPSRSSRRAASSRRRPLPRHGHRRERRLRPRSGGMQRRSRVDGRRPRQPPKPPRRSARRAPSSHGRPLRGHDHTPRPRQGLTSSGKQQSSGTITLWRRRPQKRATLSSPRRSPTRRCPLPRRAWTATQTRPPSRRRDGSYRRVQPQPERTSSAGRRRRTFSRVVTTPSTCPPAYASPPSSHASPTLRLRPS